MTAMNRTLWIVQVLLALLFAFAGVLKFVTPVGQMTTEINLPGRFIRFIGLAELLGAFGLVLPRLLRTRPGLTPLAAAGLIVIMMGAPLSTAPGHPFVHVWLPLVLGLLCAFVVWGRWRVAP